MVRSHSIFDGVLDEGFLVENKKVGFLVANKNQGKCCCFKVDDDGDGDDDGDDDAFVCVCIAKNSTVLLWVYMSFLKL